jgi:cytochrome c-type biogenesis protein
MMEQPVIQTNPAALNRRMLVFGHALLFVLGFSVVFVVGWGGAATLLGRVFGTYKNILAQMGGVVVIVFGLSTLGVLKIPWLNYDTRPEWRNSPRAGWVASAMMGVFFAAGWTPCIGATLGAILTLGFSEPSGQAMVLSSGYALGLGIPFLLIGLGMEQAAGFVRRFQRYLRTVQIASGLLLIVIGVMLLTNRLAWIAIWTQRNGFFLDLPQGAAGIPTYPIAILAGLVSFLSPCVLPLVPAYIGYLSGHAFGYTGTQTSILDKP